MGGFIRDHRELWFGFCALWVCGCMAYMLWRRSHLGPHFPPISAVRVLFREDFASGRSYGLFWRRGHAANCLIVVVTDDEVWVTTFFPFTAFVWFGGLEQRIPRDAITGLTANRKRIDLEFTASDNSTCRLSLRLRRAGEFMAALGRTLDA
jgi:hypothetical protein